MKVVQGNVESAKRVARYLLQKYSGMGYVVRPACEANAWALHVSSDGSGLGGSCKAMMGLDKDIVVRIWLQNQSVFVEAKGIYQGKLSRTLFGTFIAFGAVAVTATCGSIAQAKMAAEMENDAEGFLRYCCGAALPYAQANRALSYEVC